jgi:hypothetical protein
MRKKHIELGNIERKKKRGHLSKDKRRLERGGETKHVVVGFRRSGGIPTVRATLRAADSLSPYTFIKQNIRLPSTMYKSCLNTR